jgi:TolA-binding protein
MTGKSDPELEPLDLVARARHGALSPMEQDALDQALATSATLRMVYEVGSALDLMTRVRSSDAALLDRVIDGALTKRETRVPRRRPRLAAALAATLALASAAAATRQVLVWRSQDGLVEPPRVAGTPSAASNRNSGGLAPKVPARAALAVSEAASATAAEPSGGPSEPPPAPRLREARGAAEPSREKGTAGSLFREAGAARRAGELARARALYAELERRFPSSSEARVSRVSLGKLLLSAGNAREAEDSFAQYLRSGATALREEALVGRADALMALGRSAEESSVRAELVRRYPASVYANRARERIAELEGRNAPSSR